MHTHMPVQNAEISQNYNNTNFRFEWRNEEWQGNEAVFNSICLILSCRTLKKSFDPEGLSNPLSQDGQ